MDTTHRNDVLLVEDDPALARAICSNLAARGHGTVCVAMLGQALSFVAAGCPPVVVLDIDLPDGSGWDVARALRSAGCTETAVIVISALRPNPRLVTDLRCAAVLEKPFPIEALLRLVARAREEASPTNLPHAVTEEEALT